MTEPVVRNDEAGNRYVIEVDGELAGFAEYQLTDAGISFHHTVIDDAFEGRGIGSRLARAALDDARDRGLRVVARCSFIRGWIERHPDYRDLLGIA